MSAQPRGALPIHAPHLDQAWHVGDGCIDAWVSAGDHEVSEDKALSCYHILILEPLELPVDAWK